jgi:hypothetical protein
MFKPLQPNQKNDTTQALEFAQALADKEIDAIDRLHARTLKYLGIIATTFGLVAAAGGFIGYKNLKDVAVHTAQIQMRAEVSHQVEGVLKREDVTSIVTQAVQQNAHEEIVKIVAKETKEQIDRQLQAKEAEIGKLVSERTIKTVDGMRPFIESTTAAQVDKTLTERSAPRHLTKSEHDALIQSLSQYQSRGSIEIRSYTDDPEQREYGRELVRAFESSDWRAQFAASRDVDAEISDGLTLVYSPDNSNRLSPEAIEIIDSFKAAKIRLTFTYGAGRLLTGGTRLVLVVGPKFR